MKNPLLIKFILVSTLLLYGTGVFAQIDACITPAGPILICKGDVVTLQGNNCGTPSIVGEDYSWVNLSNGSIAPQYGQNISVIDSGRWELTLTDLSDFSSSKKIVHIKYNTPEFEINNRNSFVPKCSRSNLNLFVSTDPGLSLYKWYRVGNPTVLASAPTMTTDTIKTPWEYAVTAFHSGTGCTVKDTVYIIIQPSPYPELGAPINICQGQSVTIEPTGLTTAETFGPYQQNAYRYDWGSGFQLDSQLVVSATKMVRLTVEGPFPYNCEWKDSVQVTVRPLPVINSLPATTICYENKIGLNAVVSGPPGPYTYSWTPSSTLNNSTIQSPIATPVGPSTGYTQFYTVTVKETNFNCTSTATREVNINPDVNVSLTFSDSTVCPGSTIKLIATATGGSGVFTSASAYEWSPLTSITGINTATPDISPTSPITYKVKVKDSKFCTDSATVSIDILKVDLGSGQTFVKTGDSIKLDAANLTTPGFSFTWTDTSGATIGTSDTLWVKEGGKYTVYVSNGTCMVEASKEVIFGEEIIQKIYIPNVFNPGLSESDNSNLRVYGNNVAEENFIFRVYNNWGEIVYQTKKFSEANTIGWNGNMNNTGNPLNLGVYTYTVMGQFKDGEKFDKAGTASLLK